MAWMAVPAEHGVASSLLERSWRNEALCPFCEQQECTIMGCTDAPARVYAHTFRVTRGVSVRNDYWVCTRHASMVEHYRVLAQQGRLGCFAPLIVGALVISLSTSMNTPSQAAVALAAFAVTLGVGIWLSARPSRYARRHTLVKKAERSLPTAFGSPLDPGLD